ncbi:MAG: AMP-binding protein [Mariprofundaceae bacterium]
MSRVLEAIALYAETQPGHMAVQGNTVDQSLNYAELRQVITDLATELQQHDIRVFGMMMENSPAWIVADLAAIHAGIAVVPVPHFFSPQQIHHLLQQSGLQGLITDRPDQLQGLLTSMGVTIVRHVPLLDGRLSLLMIYTGQASSIPAAIAKVTFTSGSTGNPKGVCLSQRVIEVVAASLAEATSASSDDVHLSVLPYATLLENIGGIYAPLLSGASVCAYALASVGLEGASGLDVKRFVGALHASAATTCILIPQMLHALVAALETGIPKPERLRYIAVGGAPVSKHLLERAKALGLPVYEGYGLSEAASVVAVNRPDACRPGSVGKVLPHVELSFADDGEIVVSGNLFSGYLGEAEQKEKDRWPTGDIGYLDNDGFLHLSGRKKHIFITAFGRNVSPEWVEGELTTEASVAQACVFGEAKPFNVAIITVREGCDDKMVEHAVQAANGRLPDYARVHRWIVSDEPFSVANGMWTGTSRPRREQIWKVYGARLESLFPEE